MVANNIFLLVGRDNWQKDISSTVVLLERLNKNNIKVIWEDPVAEAIYISQRFEKKIEWLPKIFRKISLQILEIFYGLLHPSYFLFRYRGKNTSVPSRCKSLKNRILKLGIAEQTIILSRSSGARVASLIADELHFKHVICLGYPFKHPDQNDEPARYLHLEKLKTPMLILQGIDDVYGGLDVQEKYILSDKIELSFLKTDHDFNINEIMANDIVDRIKVIAN